MKYWAIIVGILAIAGIEVVALIKGVDGAAMSTAFTAIGALLGVGIYKAAKKEKK